MSDNEALSLSSKVKLTNELPVYGPDSWPYMVVQASIKNQELTIGEPLDRLMGWLCEKGVGLAVVDSKGDSDAVLSYGQVWSWIHRGETPCELSSELPSEIPMEETSNIPSTSTSNFTFDVTKVTHAGEPADHYLPGYVRRVLKQYLNDQGLISVRILSIGINSSEFHLCFSAESMGSPPKSEWPGIAEALSWFFPRSYSILIVSEKSLPFSFHLL
jgi:hypothetical protein